MHAHKQTFSANPRNTLDVSTRFPASVSADSLLTVNRAMKFGPDVRATSMEDIGWNA